MDIDPDRLLRSPWMAGAIGALVGLKFAPGITWFERTFNVLSGSLCAGYASPALAEWLHVGGDGMRGGLSFVIGLFGLSLAAAVVQGMRDAKLGDAVTSWLRKG